MNNNFKCMGNDDQLEVWNYTECDNDSPFEVKLQRGIIKDKEGHTVAKSFGYTDEFNTTQVEEIEERIQNISDWTFYFAIEATLLRLFNYNNKWYLTTHKKLDAFKSRWSCKQTFGELFVDGLDDIFGKKSCYQWFLEQISTENVYFFLIRNNQQNRIVCHTNHLKKNEMIIYMGHLKEGEDEQFQFYVKGESDLEILNSFESSEKLPKQFDNVKELAEFVNTINPFQYQGIIGFKKNSMESVKILHTEYQKYFQIRGNNPNLRFRYLEIRNNPEQLKLLYVLYPKYTMLFDEYESTFYQIAKMIYHYYVQRYIKNQYITLPREEYLLLKKCHEWHLEDRKNNMIYTQKILEILGQESPLHLYKMIQRYQMENTDLNKKFDFFNNKTRMEGGNYTYSNKFYRNNHKTSYSSSFSFYNKDS